MFLNLNYAYGKLLEAKKKKSNKKKRYKETQATKKKNAPSKVRQGGRSDVQGSGKMQDLRIEERITVGSFHYPRGNSLKI